MTSLRSSVFRIWLFVLFAISALQATAQPDILVLGDSQISFGAGKEYLRFFEQLPERCEMTPKRKRALAALGDRKTAAIGVRSTSLQSWTTPKGAAKGAICDVDKKFGVNAGAYGIDGNNKRVFIQIGKGRAYQFCKPKQTAFEAMFADSYYAPELLVLTFLGNSADRWANSPELALEDARRTLQQIPDNVPCVFISSVPVYLKKTNDKRMKGQTEIARAFQKAGKQCAVVEGFNARTRNAIEGKPVYFRRNDAGKVKDPHHPKPAAIRAFLDINTVDICDAVFRVLK
ncbi:SGNH/GDSL hydrolase family protein [Shimia sp. R9_3]|uniref:SGNH/GDSL hydrolase family protein n=1 Tax=Shimia sp. R9_3 TaxID=2821113 RepID=UPI001ADC8D0E|nr:SGNH/GDSL hydrolase family protein [Shimia sp. R9_3]MBO9401328.1 SGNH/GDSL hydrolase family protein [Shimia sp. R9_3]